VTASPNPAQAGRPVTLTAQVSGTTTPTGTVEFSDTTPAGTTSLGTATLTNATATLTVTDLTPGRHNITATYRGDPNSDPSTSPPYPLTIEPTGTIPGPPHHPPGHPHTQAQDHTGSGNHTAGNHPESQTHSHSHTSIHVKVS
jgi:hypothetical protein